MKSARLYIPLIALACALFGAAASARNAPASGQQTPAAPPRQTPTPPEPVPVETPVTARVVRVPVTVLDKKGVPVTGLTRNDFTVLEEKRPVQFDFLGEIKELEKLPIYIGVLMDTS